MSCILVIKKVFDERVYLKKDNKLLLSSPEWSEFSKTDFTPDPEPPKTDSEKTDSEKTDSDKTDSDKQIPTAKSKMTDQSSKPKASPDSK